MRVGNLGGRASLIFDAGALDIARASEGGFPAELGSLFEQWDAFASWANSGCYAADLEPYDPTMLRAPSPTPRQVFAVGLNYADHALEEVGLHQLPQTPAVFTKFPTCIAAPFGELALPSGNVDWEVELVVVIGKRSYRVSDTHALDYVAGYTVGQDFSERTLQLSGDMPQFSLGKSFVGFGPIGPWLMTVDEFEDLNDLSLQCLVNGEMVQSSNTSRMIFPVQELVSRLSNVCPLLPGDLIFTGTPAGVGVARSPQRFLKPGDEVVSSIAEIGTMRQKCVATEDL